MPALLLMVTVLSVRSVPLSGSNSAYVLRRKMSWLASSMQFSPRDDVVKLDNYLGIYYQNENAHVAFREHPRYL
jgi:hypothetical protein